MKIPVLIALLSLTAGSAWAHAFLRHADPGAGAQLKAPPKQLTLTFSEALEPAFSGVSVTDAEGRDVAANAVQVSAATMIVALKPLAQGTYHVAWHAVSPDTHRTDGKYSFAIKP